MLERKDVFISYNFKSASGIVSEIAEALEKADISCWYAQRDSNGPYAEAIVEAINRCSVFLLILDESANHSEHIKNEVDRAFARVSNHENISLLVLHTGDFEPNPNLRYYLSRFTILKRGVPLQEAEIEDLVNRIANLKHPFDIKKDEIGRLLKSGSEYLSEKSFSEAQHYFKTVIQRDQRSLLAYMGLLLCKLEALTLDDFVEKGITIDVIEHDIQYAYEWRNIGLYAPPELIDDFVQFDRKIQERLLEKRNKEQKQFWRVVGVIYQMSAIVISFLVAFFCPREDMTMSICWAVANKFQLYETAVYEYATTQYPWWDIFHLFGESVTRTSTRKVLFDYFPNIVEPTLEIVLFILIALLCVVLFRFVWFLIRLPSDNSDSVKQGQKKKTSAQ